MRLKRYITEEIHFGDDIIDAIDYLKNSFVKVDFKGLKKFILECDREPLYRGVEAPDFDISDVMIKKSHLRDRNPKDTRATTHKIWNKLFREKFGWNVRNGVFVTSKKYDADVYGEVCYFYPLGKYEYCWNPEVPDLHGSNIAKIVGSRKDAENWYAWREYPASSFPNDLRKYYSDLDFTSLTTFMNSAEKIMEKHIVSGYSNKNLASAVRNGCEISFKCDLYILSRNDLSDWIIQEVK